AYAVPTIGEITTPGCFEWSIGLIGASAPACGATSTPTFGRRTCGSRCRPRHAHALAILFDLDFVQPGFVEKLGKLEDQLTIDDCFRRLCHCVALSSFAWRPA